MNSAHSFASADMELEDLKQDRSDGNPFKMIEPGSKTLPRSLLMTGATGSVIPACQGFILANLTKT